MKNEPDRRLPRRYRMTQTAEFQRVYRNGTSFAGALMVLFVLNEPGLVCKVGFVAGRKVGNAVKRNRAKRLLRESFRHHQRLLPAKNIHLVLVARSGCAEADRIAVEQEFLRLLARAAHLTIPAGGSGQTAETP